MKKVLFIARAKTDQSKQSAERFATSIQRQLGDDIQIENCEISELFFTIDKDGMAVYHPGKKFDLKDFDVVIIRHIGKYSVEAHAITLYCEAHGITYTDTYLNRILLDNKLSTMFLLQVAGVNIWPKTFYGPARELKRRFTELDGRAVLKDNEGSKGRLNFVVRNGDDIQKIIDENPERQFILQEFIPNDSDLRVLVLNGKPQLVIRRSSDGSSHLNNTSQGGDAQIIPVNSIDPEVLDVCVRAANAAKLQVAGVDVVQNIDTGEYYLFEINNAPQISSGSFMEQKAEVYAAMVRELVDA